MKLETNGPMVLKCVDLSHQEWMHNTAINKNRELDP